MAYIPAKHDKYDLLPLCKKLGGEVFSYPSETIDEIHSLINEEENLIPYGFDSYEAYDALLDKLIKKYKSENARQNVIVEKLEMLKKQIKLMNIKENWSVVQYVGKTTSDFTMGRCYYWPCHEETPKYEGIIDDEEFTSYLHDIQATDWRIIEDPFETAQGVLNCVLQHEKTN